MTTPQHVLAIVGGAFLIGMGQAAFFGSVTLGPSATKSGTEGVTPDPKRAGAKEPAVETPSAGDPMVDAPSETGNPGSGAVPEVLPPSSFSGASKAGKAHLLDAPVPEGTLTLREAHQLWEEGAYFLDARREEEFEAGHIQYAAYLESKLFDTDLDRANAVMDSIPLNGTIVLYCVGGECDASKNTAAMLEQYGYTDLRIMGAGYEHWVAAGFPVEKGVQP